MVKYNQVSVGINQTIAGESERYLIMAPVFKATVYLTLQISLQFLVRFSPFDGCERVD
jgi:hypothetical protein